MRTRHFNPRRLDVPAFARDQAHLEGQWPISSLDRLGPSLHPAQTLVPEETSVSWSAQGLSRQAPGAVAQMRLHLRARCRAALTCQRCLQPVEELLEVDRVIRFVFDEDEAARLDEQGEEDVLACSRAVDLQALVEDELILALPLVPRHVHCAFPLVPALLPPQAPVG